jgi:LuxR family maltose regulon positive regulatory protein
VRARVQLAAGDLASAGDWVAESGVDTADEPSYLREYEHLTLVRVLLARPAGPATEAVQLLERLELAAQAAGREGSLAEIRRLLDQARVPATEAGPATIRRDAQGQPTEALTGREFEVLRLLDSELSGPEIARRLFVSHNTLRTHTRHIFTKLEVTTRRAAVARARERGLI